MMTDQYTQPAVCPHGCRTPGECLRYALPDDPPADCLLEQQDPRTHATPNPHVARTIRVYAEFWVRALTTIAKHHWHRHHPTNET